MDRPSVYAKSVRKGTVSTILALVLLTAACLVHVTPSPAAQGDDDATLRHMVQYIMSVGQQQYDRGYYSEAEKTFQSGPEVLAVPRCGRAAKARSRFGTKAGKATTERKRIVEVRQSADQLSRKGDLLLLRTRLESIRDSEFLTDQERQEIAALLRGANPSAGTPAPRITAPSQDDVALPVPVAAERRPWIRRRKPGLPPVMRSSGTRAA